MCLCPCRCPAAVFCCLPHATTQETLASLPTHVKASSQEGHGLSHLAHGAYVWTPLDAVGSGCALQLLCFAAIAVCSCCAFELLCF